MELLVGAFFLLDFFHDVERTDVDRDAVVQHVEFGQLTDHSGERRLGQALYDEDALVVAIEVVALIGF